MNAPSVPGQGITRINPGADKMNPVDTQEYEVNTML